MKRVLAAAVAALAVFGLAGCGDDDDDDAAGGGEELVGLFRIDAGACAGAISGSWFKMVQVNGTLDTGPFVINGDSACADKNFTALAPGSDGGLATGEYQPHPTPVFDAGKNGAANRITQPAGFFAVNFALATNPRDPQTDRDAPEPSISNDGGRLTGDLSALGVAWNDQHFNQGSPKPGGDQPGLTSPVAGTYDPASRRFTLQWSSQIVGGPFNNFTGIWHLEGTFEPR